MNEIVRTFHSAPYDKVSIHASSMVVYVIHLRQMFIPILIYLINEDIWKHEYIYKDTK